MPIREQLVRMSPVRFVVVLLGTVFVSEAGIMLLLPVILPAYTSSLFEAGVDASLLVVILAPVLWWVIIRPLQSGAVGEHQRATRLVAILEATPDLVGMAEPEGRLVYLNPAGRRMLSIDELVDLTRYNIREFHDAANANVGLAEGIPTAMRDGVWSGETELMALDRHRIAISQVIVAHKAPNGTVTLLSTIARDITERKRAEKSLRLQSAALSAAADAIVITDRACVIEWVNPAFTQLTGYTAEEALGKSFRDLVKSGKQAPAFYKHLWETILAGRTWHGEMINRRKDGRLYTEDQAVTPIRGASGRITHFVAIKRDMTEHLQLEAQFRQAHKMEGVGQLASGIAHDFNNLLTVINGMSELVLAQVDQDSPVHADVQEIVHAGERAAALTRQLLAFSRQQSLEPRVLSLNMVVAGMEDLLRRLLGEDVDLVVVLAPDVGRVKADPGQLEQVMTNLAVNARDAMPQGGQLTIETQNDTLDEDYARQHTVVVPAGAYILLTMTDSGVGMDETTLAHLFEPFFTTKGPGKGTGLGLSTVYGIVKQSGGFVWIESEVGQGTSVKIYLPRVTEAADIDLPKPTVMSTSGTETILLVEDNAGLRKLTTRVLEPAGYTVLAAATGEEALRLLEQHDERVHLLLSDVVMPGMSGRHLAERLAGARPGMRVLYMSGYTSDTVVRHGVLEAQMAFLNKPFTGPALLRKVREVLDSKA